MENVSTICMRCKGHGYSVWLRTKDHFFDSEYESLLKELRKAGYGIKKLGNESFSIIDRKNKSSILVNKHECGPEIVYDVVKGVMAQAIIILIVELFKKLVGQKAKRNKERPTYKVLVIQNNRVTEYNTTYNFLSSFKKKSNKRLGCPQRDKIDRKRLLPRK
jgi:hypothetical protein